MLPDQIKEEIQQAYKQILASKSLRPRYGQRLMIAEIARSLADIDAEGDVCEGAAEGSAESGAGPVCVIEAGTGTGKTLAYVLGTLPLARHLGKKVVLATATVALQEQVTLRDLPDIAKHSGLSFTYTLAKGRGRYLCLSRLDQILQGNDSENAMLALFGDDVRDLGAQTPGDTALYESMLDKISRGEWQGDRDDWDGVLRDSEWSPVTVEAGQCAGQKCSNYSRCFFYQAREQVQKVDCVVANHDLVLVDLALGGGAILPAPEDTIYIFDEAHHLPAKTNQHFSSSTRLRATMQWLDASARTLARLAADTVINDNGVIVREQSDIKPLFKQISEALGTTLLLLEPLLKSNANVDGQQRGAGGYQGGGDSGDAMTFALGVVPAELREQAVQLASRFYRLTRGLKEISTVLRRQMEEADTLPGRQHAEQWFPLLGSMTSRAEASEKLWQAFASQDSADQAPSARWLSQVEQEDSVDIVLSCSPVLAAHTLTEHLWQRCAGAVLTSATLSALEKFDVLAMRAGLPAHTVYHRIASPFDYASAARLIIPKLNCDPSNNRAHTAAIVALLPQLLDKKEASLMLFSSRRQMLDVLEGMSDEWRHIILCQDDYQKAQLLNFHRQRIDKGEPSVIFGLASFAEGVDLPGKYCEHVLIAKIPFAVPNDPIEATLAQWLEQQGKNPFMTLSVPEAAFRLVQASGRLLRSESDTGRITLFDERVISKFYGKAILASLPPFTREIFPAHLTLPDPAAV
ncbi:ATP-dependent DNA helicase DinG [Pseudohongiella sp.]|uniref:Helicase ATP-binding domain-containing protein n=1 Tax=marine sediment metagenome TaxID=412755 RepID=A0A0F9Z0Z9_9ZZZZ|nr:ATP-dependent DNA helicase DinG [Pseudohongiella sp.]HDZ08433.1 ATP-dependent DNA helicase DinG [Pseudohongiella sp.]HEA62798.1 ATP-dependent DNA helicase DinG [Pseudohongiella sp.]